MLKRIVLLLCAVIFCANVRSAVEEPGEEPDIEKEYRALVERFIDCVKNNKVEELAKMVQYPLHRDYPIPAIVSAEDFVKRYRQIFDEELIKEISEPDMLYDWRDDSWRGIMLTNGLIWLDHDGKLIRINHVSKYEKDLRKRWIEEQRAKLHQSIQKFDSPVLEGKTEKFLIRVDAMDDGYRYAAWSLPKKWSDKPDIIIYKGWDKEPRGFMDLPAWIFKTGPYIYRIDLNKPESELKVSRGQERILQQSFVESYWDDSALNRYFYPCYFYPIVPEESDIEKEYRPSVERFIDCVKNNKVEELAKIVDYPLYRSYPIPPIVSADDFVKRYNQLFDGELIKKISESDLSKDWSTAGYRGAMLESGILWIDCYGKLYCVNYVSKYEENLRKKLIEEQKTGLHLSLQKFDRPVLDCRTEKFLIRIDDMGGCSYRYAAWSLPKQWSDEPDIIIYGEELLEGSLPSVTYVFKNGPYTYTMYADGIGEGNRIGALEVFKGKKKILEQDIVEVHR